VSKSKQLRNGYLCEGLGFMFTVEVGEKKERKKEKNTLWHWDSFT
jgi:hypothetical protein